MPRKRWSLTWIVLLAGLALAVAILRPDCKLGRSLRVGTAVVAQTLC
jgi:hypothetical protein